MALYKQMAHNHEDEYKANRTKDQEEEHNTHEVRQASRDFEHEHATRLNCLHDTQADIEAATASQANRNAESVGVTDATDAPCSGQTQVCDRCNGQGGHNICDRCGGLGTLDYEPCGVCSADCKPDKGPIQSNPRAKGHTSPAPPATARPKVQPDNKPQNDQQRRNKPKDRRLNPKEAGKQRRALNVVYAQRPRSQPRRRRWRATLPTRPARTQHYKVWWGSNGGTCRQRSQREEA